MRKIRMLCVLTKYTIPANGWILYPKLYKMPSSTNNDKIVCDLIRQVNDTAMQYCVCSTINSNNKDTSMLEVNQVVRVLVVLLIPRIKYMMIIIILLIEPVEVVMTPVVVVIVRLVVVVVEVLVMVQEVVVIEIAMKLIVIQILLRVAVIA